MLLLLTQEAAVYCNNTVVRTKYIIKQWRQKLSMLRYPHHPRLLLDAVAAEVEV